MTAAAAVEAISAALKKECDRIRGLLANSDRYDARARYALGELVLRSREHRRYGSRAVAHIEAELGIGRRSLYRFADIVKEWPRPEFDAVMTRRNAHGLPLTWTHLSLLSDLPKSKRPALIERSLRESLSSMDLATVINGGELRVVGEDRDPDALRVQRMAARAEGLIETLRRFETDVLRTLPAKRSRDVSQSLRHARKTYEQLRAECDRIIGRLVADLDA